MPGALLGTVVSSTDKELSQMGLFTWFTGWSLAYHIRIPFIKAFFFQTQMLSVSLSQYKSTSNASKAFSAELQLWSTTVLQIGSLKLQGIGCCWLFIASY